MKHSEMAGNEGIHFCVQGLNTISTRRDIITSVTMQILFDLWMTPGICGSSLSCPQCKRCQFFKMSSIWLLNTKEIPRNKKHRTVRWIQALTMVVWGLDFRTFLPTPNATSDNLPSTSFFFWSQMRADRHTLGGCSSCEPNKAASTNQQAASV